MSHYGAMLEARAEAESALSLAYTAQIDRDAAVAALNECRDRCARLEELANEERLAHSKSSVTSSELRQQLEQLQSEVSRLRMNASTA